MISKDDRLNMDVSQTVENNILGPGAGARLACVMDCLSKDLK